MLVEIIHKLVAAKVFTSFLLLIALGAIKELEEDEYNEEAPGDNFPHAVMYR